MVGWRRTGLLAGAGLLVVVLAAFSLRQSIGDRTSLVSAGGGPLRQRIASLEEQAEKVIQPAPPNQCPSLFPVELRSFLRACCTSYR